jgi:treble-clef zinc-finger protein
MDALTEKQIRGSFVNATKGEAARLGLPRDLEDQPWDELDLLAWVDPRSPLAGYLVFPTPERGPVGVQLRRSAGAGTRRARMCALCATTHVGEGVALMVAPRAGKPGREGNTVGLEMCSSLECSSYARGVLKPPGVNFVRETLSVPERRERLRRNVMTFVDRVAA